MKYYKQKNQSLQSQLHRDSHNSSQPLSRDGLKKKVVNSRVCSGRKIGGQPSHKGSTLNYAGDVDKIISHFPKESCTCGIAYRQTKQSTTNVLDLPKLNSEVTQHISEHWHCRKCGKTYYSRKFKGNKEQYGEQLKSLAIYLKDYHFIPYQRLSTLFKDCFSLSLSEGTLSNFTATAYHNLEEVEQSLKTNLLKSPHLHVDETGLRSQGKNHWMHVASNDKYTWYHFDAKRGIEAIERAALLPNYQGTLVHDRFSCYFRYGAKHSLCNAHLLRELIFLEEQGHL